MILRQMLGHVAVKPVHEPVPEALPNRPWGSVVALGGDPLGRPPGHGPGRAAPGLGGREGSGIAEPCVNQVAISGNRPVQVTPRSLDCDLRFIDIPALAHGTMAPLAQRVTQERSPFRLPVPHSFMRNDEPPREKHLCQVPSAHLVAEASQDHQTDHLRWLRQTVQGRSRPLVQPALALATAQAAVPQLRLIRARGRGGRWALGTPHLIPPGGEVSVHPEPEEPKMARKLTEPARAVALPG
jgi:hypothetical protein